MNLREHRIWSKLFKAVENHPHRDEVLSLHACAIVRGGKLLSLEVNMPKRNSFVRHYRHHDAANLHSECAAVLAVRNKIDLTHAKMYVLRLKKQDNTMAMSKPCPMCQAVIIAYGIKRVYYSTSEGYERL